MNMFKNFTVAGRLSLFAGVMLALLLGVGFSGMRGMSFGNERLKTVYEDRTVCLVQLSHVMDAIYRVRVAMYGAVGARDAQASSAALKDLPKYDEQFEKYWKEYTSTKLTDEEKKVADSFRPAWQLYVAKREDVRSALGSGDRDAAAARLAEG